MSRSLLNACSVDRGPERSQLHRDVRPGGICRNFLVAGGGELSSLRGDLGTVADDVVDVDVLEQRQIALRQMRHVPNESEEVALRLGRRLLDTGGRATGPSGIAWTAAAPAAA